MQQRSLPLLTNELMELEEDLPDRTCIVSRTVLDEGALIRFVRSPDGLVVPDLARKLPGRGVWVSLARSKVAEAQKKSMFARGFKAESRADAALADLVGAQLRKQALGYLSLARKAGEAIFGFTKVEEMLAQGKAGVLIHAADASPDQCQKLKFAASGGIAIIKTFTDEELDLALGRIHVVHAAVAKGALAEKLLAAARRVEAYEAN